MRFKSCSEGRFGISNLVWEIGMAVRRFNIGAYFYRQVITTAGADLIRLLLSEVATDNRTGVTDIRLARFSYK
jgi:hypothetical protein